MFGYGEFGGAGGAGALGTAGAITDLRPTVLAIGRVDDAATLGAIAQGAGLRFLGSVAWDHAAARLDRMIGADILLLDLREEGGGAGDSDALLRPVVGWPSVGDARLIALVDLARLDSVDAALCGLHAELLCDATTGNGRWRCAAPRPGSIGRANCTMSVAIRKLTGWRC